MNSTPRGLRVLLAMIERESSQESPVPVFTHWPMAQFVQDFGVDHFEASVAAMKIITRRASCEFAVRPFLVRYPE